MQYQGPEMAPAAGICFFAVYAIIILAIVIISVLIYCKIFSKAGYHWAMGLIALVPLGNLILLLILAFGQWPIQRELEAMRHARMAPPPEGQPHESFRGV